MIGAGTRDVESHQVDSYDFYRHVSLSRFALALDTPGYTNSPQSQSPASFGLTLSPKFSIDVIDSSVEEESLQAVAVLFYGIAVHSGCLLSFWKCGEEWKLT